MNELRIRSYNVRFGDALLISLPDRDGNGDETLRHILIDVGNVLAGEGGRDHLFEPIMRDILATLDGQPLDLYVMTHEHLDHVQGLPYAAKKLDMELSVRYAWLTASSAPDYYDHHPDARQRRLQALAAYEEIATYLQAAPEAETAWLRAMMLNNDPRSTADCVDYLRALADTTTYVHRGLDLSGTHPFQETQLDIWAPEEDTSIYYGRFQPMALGVKQPIARTTGPRLLDHVPPEGVDAGAFYNLVDARRHGYAENMLAIDRAANNTSIVFALTWRGWTLLFPGDAETRSWRTMSKLDLLQPVHVLKASHHGSANGTPPVEILDRILPEQPTDDRQRLIILSTFEGTYNDVPSRETVSMLAKRAQIRSVEGIADGQALDILLPDLTAAETTLALPHVFVRTDPEGGRTMPDQTTRVCIDRILPIERVVDAAERAVDENPVNTPILRPGFGIAPPNRAQLAAITGKLWRPGRTLRVRFMDGEPTVKAKVEAIAQTWSQHANLALEFGDFADADLRVSFGQRGSWSYIGTDALAVPTPNPTINFGWLTSTSSDDEYERVVLHEFGHALGCIHEHQSPGAAIPWDKEAVYAYYAGPPNFWTRDEVDANLFSKYDQTITQFSQFDPASIMLYPIDEAHTVGDFSVGWNRQLSATDQSFIGVLYPFDTHPATAIIVDGPAVSESIGAHGEQDLFRFEVVNAGRYRIETIGWTDVTMALLGPGNQTNVITEDDDSGRRLNAKIEADLAPGTYYVRVHHFRPTGTGEYQVAVTSL